MRISSASICLITSVAPAFAQDAGLDLATALGHPTSQMMGLTGPSAAQGITLSQTRTLDVTEAFPDLDGYLMRSRYIVVGAGGIVPLHSHAERPAVTYVMNGSIQEMRSDETAPLRRSGGDVIFDADIAQWWYNDGDEPVFIFVGDLCPAESEPACTLDPAAPAPAISYVPSADAEWPEGAGTTTIDGVDGPADPYLEEVEVLGTIDLAEALSEIEASAALEGVALRARRVTVEPGGVVPLHTQPMRPNYFVATKGSLTYFGPEGSFTVTPTQTVEDFGAEPTWWMNQGDVTFELIAVDVVALE